MELKELEKQINIKLDEIHAQVRSNLKTLARSTGQYLKTKPHRTAKRPSIGKVFHAAL